MVNVYSLSPGREEAEANILDAEVLEDPQLSVTMYWVIQSQILRCQPLKWLDSISPKEVF